MRKTSVTINSNISGSGIHGASQSGRHMWSYTGSQIRENWTSAGGSSDKGNGRGGNPQTPRRAVQVLDEDGSDVTPLPLYDAESGDTPPKPGRFFLDEMFSSSGSDHLQSNTSVRVRSSSSFMGSSQRSSLPNKASLTRDTEDSLPKLDAPINPPAPYELPRKRNNVKQHMTEEKLDEVIDICLSETDTISLLDINSTVVSEDADDAEVIKERNLHYAELCRNKVGSDKYEERSVQTVSGAPKDKHIQCDKIAMVNEGTTATVWDIYDSFCSQNNASESEKNYPENTLNTSNIQENRQEKSSSSNTTGTDPDSTVKPRTEEQSEGDKTSYLTPTLERLWAFSCELTRGWNVTSMSWNKKNPDLLAVGYGDLMNQKPGLICCWSLKNPVWPERVFHCHSCVISMDFSANNPGQLAVGMFDGTVALYNVQCQDDWACTASSSACTKKHLHPVWQIKWSRQEMRLSGVERVEALVSVSADGRIKKWLLCSNGLECLDLMELKRTDHPKAQAPKKKKKGSKLSIMTPGLCIDFHSIDSSVYLIGTQDGLIHKCSISNTQYFLDTYRKHFGQVNHVEWSPFSPDVFLSCSSDWTIQLWRQSHLSPVMAFTSTQKTVYCIRWSPNYSTVFAAINGRQVEIWDLNKCILHPTIVHHAAPGVKMTALLFATGSDCILVGDSEGRVTVYKLKNFSVGDSKQVDSLDDIIRSAASRVQKL
ncbi:dynein axonemal intermediate chain 4-like isoform X2 [Trachinotus anak]|uniref:dynein axonemal intermediate chain 4-like isoform X2 n=1 Tax=Trachinotus anak TaxID=443729 RepID=UPI0039F1D3C9